ncbi:F-box only protein 12-like [Triticum dicoccoides]|uniref:F-box only protein 12-like n=1 Tax=Triticum dicoccoides TaxID=85692 RepID=UPI00188FA9AC|nr:F-box only protein 12-like [Triticum dicoccoides]
MAEAASEGATPPHHGLPDEIFIWEILVRLPPKSLLRCRAVCRAWRSATSARGFLLAHHARQPTLPLVYVRNRDFNDGVFPYGHDGNNASLDIIPVDHRAAADHLRSVARLDQASDFYRLEGSCDGLLVLSLDDDTHFVICNPATLIAGSKDDCYVLSLGSGQPPRNIGPEQTHKLISDTRSVLFRGRLYWYRVQEKVKNNMIIVFDITAESFRQMHVPVRGCTGDDLFEMDGMLGMSSFRDTWTIIDIWVLQDYESEVWTIKCKIELPLMEIRAWCRKDDELCELVVVPGDGELLVLIKFAEWLFQVGMDGKLVATFHRKGVRPTQFQLKQTLVQHDFFPTLEGYVVNNFPFI